MFFTKRRRRSSAASSRDDRASRTLARIVGVLGRRDAANALLVVLILAAQAAVFAAPPLVLRALLDAIPRRDVGSVYEMAMILVGLTVALSLLSLWHRRLSARVGYGLLHRLQVKLYHHLERLPLSFFTRTPAGDIQSALTENFTVLRDLVVRDTTSWLYAIDTVLWGFLVLYTLDSRLAAIACMATPVVVVWSAVITRISARTARDQRAAASRQSTVAREGMSVDGVVAMKTLGGRTLADRFQSESREIRQHATRLDVLVRWASMPVELSSVLITTGLFSYVALQAIHGKPAPSVGTLVVFAGALTSFLFALRTVMERQLDLTSLLGRFEKIFALLDTKIEIAPGKRHLSGQAPGELAFDRVSFRYGPELPWVLEDLTLRVPAGTCVAIVGASGAGKTTLGLLAVRLHDATEGRVSIDGIDIKELTFDSLHRVGYVPQNPFLFHDTIRANICLASPDATDDDIVEAARSAQIHDWIMGLQDGYDAVVGTDGYRLSGGQAQRTIIARTLLNDPPLLVLDEATSALDNATQLEVDKALHQLEQGRTTLLIAHRLSTVRRADQIVVLDRGRIVESGTHEQLLELDGKYVELVRAEQP